MSREIKFRVWDKEYKEYRYDLNLAVTLEGELYAVWAYHPQKITSNVYIIEQYTGLKDNNGKEIYEGDIILAFGFCHKYTVEWSEKYAAFETIDLTDGEMGPSIEFTAKYATVIGNIHENPELLGGEE